jgi:hypothetical protein
MATFVLVHGAWHGSWCWKRVRKALQQQGHEVFTPTLTGVGERSHLLSESVDLQTHTMDVLNLIQWEELTDFVLCAIPMVAWWSRASPTGSHNVFAHWYFSMPSYLRTERALCNSRPYQGISSSMAGKAGHSVPKHLASIPLILLG